MKIRRKSTEYWFKSDRQSSLQDVLKMMSKRKRELASGKTSKKAPVQALTPASNPPLQRKRLLKKESFLKAHDRLENYHVCIELANIRFAPECQLLANCESILVKIDRGQLRFVQDQVFFEQLTEDGNEMVLPVGLTLRMQTRVFCKNEDGLYREKPATVKVFAINQNDLPPNIDQFEEPSDPAAVLVINLA